MNISEFTALDRQAQLEEAGRIAGVEPKVFDGIWRTESSRGQNMLSPAGAEGHFGLMPETRATMERRFGTTINPHDFGQSLYTSAHLVAENMRAFKNLPDALRAYNGGWDRKRWGNPETSAYAGKVLGEGGDALVPTASSPLPEVSALSQKSASELWDIPFATAQKAPVEKTAGATAVSKLVASIQQMPPSTPLAPPTFEIADATLKATADAQVKAQAEKDATSFLDMSRAFATSTAPVRALILFNQDPEPADPNFKVTEDMLQGRDLEQQKDLILARSDKEFNRIKFEQDDQREQDRIANIHGAGWAMAAGMFASLPEAALFGGATTLALRGAGVGSVALAQAGNRTGALLSSAAEGVIGNVINTAALDMLGERQGVNAYVLGATLGLVNPMLSGRYLGTLASKSAEFQEAQRLMAVATAKEEKWMTRATTELGENADPELVRAKMDQYEAEELRANTASHRQAVPESRKMTAGDPDAVRANMEDTANPEDLKAVKQASEAGEANVEAITIPGSEYGSLQRAREANTFTGQPSDAGRGQGFTQPKGTPPEKLFSNFADTAANAKPEAQAKFRDAMFSRADAEVKAFQNEGVAHYAERRGNSRFEVDTSRGGTTRIRMLDDEGNIVAVARFKKGLLDSVASAEKGKGAGKAILQYADERGIGNIDEVPDRSPGFVKVQKELISERLDSVQAAAPETADIIDNIKENFAKAATPYEDPAFLRTQRMQGQLGLQDSKFQALTGHTYQDIANLPTGVHVAPKLAALMAEDKVVANAVAILQRLGQTYLPAGHRLLIGDASDLGSVATNAGKKGAARGGALSADDVHAVGIDFKNLDGRNLKNHVAIHELGHIIFQSNLKDVPKDLLARMDAEWAAAAKKIFAGDITARESRLAVTNPGRFDTTPLGVGDYAVSRTEYAAEQFVTHIQNKLLSGDFGTLDKGMVANIMDGVRAAVNYAIDVVKAGFIKPGKAFDEFFNGIPRGAFLKKAESELLAPDLKLPDLDSIAASATEEGMDKLAKEVKEFLTDPVVLRHGLDRLPMGTPAERAEAKMIRDLYAKAESPEYMVDEKRLNSILKAFPSLNPTSNIMLRSKNPVVRMAAIELLENGGGAGGRRSTASIAKHMNERAIIGNSIMDLDRSFKAWFAGQDNKGAVSEFFTGQKKAEFNRLVAEEIEQRRQTGPKTDYGDFVRSAADTMEQAFERSRLMQVDAKTAGWGALPESSIGYIPHRIKSNVYRTLSIEQKRALHAELTDQFITVSKFDPTFSDQLASRYLDRAEQRALGGFDMPMGIHQTGAPDMIREAMEQMGMTRPEIDSMMRRHVAGAANHTKKRLNIDLSKSVTLEDGSTFNLMDIYDTDMLSLLRGQAQRVSGEVALARHGVLGKPGLTLMRRAMGYGGDGEQAVLTEVEAFDQVGAEFMGQPFGTTNKWVDRAVQFNSVSSLGGMGFNQLGEQINVASTLGVKSALSIVPEFARLRAEILKSVRTGKTNNELLQYVETMGGAEFGTDAYKMVFPLDNPDLFQNSLGPDSINAGDKLLRGAGHLQSKLSLWRSIHSVQVRATAEQIVMKTGLALREGKADYHLRDMGIGDDILERLRPDMQQIVHIRNGRVIKFDITKATDKEAAHALIQGIHRGASQIIQGTFIGETGKYVHNSWLRMLTQFRTFSLTAIDKQWNRQVGNRGVGGAVILTLAAMSAAAPIYMIRTYLAALGREDREEYLERHLSPGSIARATTNYIATSGLAGDFMDALTAVTGTGAMTGGRSGTATTLTGNLIAPAAGKVDKLWGAVQNTKDGTDPHALIKELPLSRLPFLIPAINALND